MGTNKEMLLDDRTTGAAAGAEALAPEPLRPRREGHSLVDQIGNTPLLRLARLSKDFPAVEASLRTHRLRDPRQG